MRNKDLNHAHGRILDSNGIVPNETAIYCKLSAFLSDLKPAETIIVSDMSGTLLHQTEEGFPDDQRKIISELLSAACPFVLVTGDSLATVKHTFIERLNYNGPGTIVLVTGSGYQISSFRNGMIETIFRGKGIDLDNRRQMLSVIEDLIHRRCGRNFQFNEEQKKDFLIGEGRRIDIREQLENRPSRFMVEIVPNKVNIYFPDTPRSDGQDLELLKMLESDLLVQRIAHEKSINVVRGPNFVDIISSRKEEGLAVLLASPEGKSLGIQRKNIVVLGDSVNDEGILRFEWENAGQTVRVFLGDDDDFVARINSEGVFYLKGRYTQGSRLVMKLIVHQVDNLSADC